MGETQWIPLWKTIKGDVEEDKVTLGGTKRDSRGLAPSHSLFFFWSVEAVYIEEVFIPTFSLILFNFYNTYLNSKE